LATVPNCRYEEHEKRQKRHDQTNIPKAPRFSSFTFAKREQQPMRERAYAVVKEQA
jgi:hypothetical protein